MWETKLMSSVLILCICAGLASKARAFQQQQDTQQKAAKRLVTVADAIRMMKLGDPVGEGKGRVAEFSPDGHKFVLVLRKGNIDKNTNEYSLVLWKTDRVDLSSSRVLVTMSSSSNRAGIDRVTWVDNDTIAFLGENPGELHQLFSVNSATLELRRLVYHPTNLLYYSVTQDAKNIAYAAEAPENPLFDEDTARKGLAVDDRSRLAGGIGNLIEQKVGAMLSYPELYVESEGGPTKRIRTEGAIQMFGGGANIALSPDGNYLVMTLRAEKIPIEWQEYSDAWIQLASKEKIRAGDYSNLMTYVVINTRNGQDSVLLNVPVKMGFKVAWSPDSRSVVVGETYLPLDHTTGQEREFRRSHPFAVEVEVLSGRATVISSDELRLTTWDQTTGRLLFHRGSTIDFLEGKLTSEGEEVRFEKRDGRWAQLPETSGEQLQIRVEQDSNTPPKIYAARPGGGAKILLLDLNPQFRELSFGRVEEIAVRGRRRNIKAGVYYPVDYIPGNKYPLVIQTHGWSKDKFWIDGPFTTAFAAQALASRGVMVVQLSFMDEDKVGTSDEAPLESSQFESVIDYLDGKGMIDRNHVGIIGFSRTCFAVKYSLTHSKFRFAAASITDGFDGGYISYVLSTPFVSAIQDLESVNGGPPFGKTFNSWLVRAPDLNLPRVNAPLLITSLSPSGAVFDWEWFGVLSLLGKPVDMVVMKDGSHELQRPWDRMISQQGTVDWFCFWLKAEEDADPTKAQQYARWRELRKLQEQNQDDAATK